MCNRKGIDRTNGPALPALPAWRTGLLLFPGLACLIACSGCGTERELLGSEGRYVFVAFDQLALPGEAVELRARIQAGDLLRPVEGAVVRFVRNGRLYRAAETDDGGVAAVTFRTDEPGDHGFVAEAAPNGLSAAPPAPREFVVACRRADEAMVVVDLDKTLVASGFEQVLIGDPEPMVDSVRVMKRLAGRYEIVYLTHRPDYFGPKSKSWLNEQGFPEAPLLLSDVSGFLKGSREFKSQVLEGLVSRFHGLRVGIGDKVSDARAYHEQGIKAVLIIHEPRPATPEALRRLAGEVRDLPSGIEVVWNWKEVEAAVFEDRSFPPSRIAGTLMDRAGRNGEKK